MTRAWARIEPWGQSEADAPMRLEIPVEDVAPLLGLTEALNDRQRAVFADAVSARRTIGLADCFRLLRQLAFTAGEETFALSARPIMKGTAEFVFSRAAGAATVGEGLRQIAAAYNLMHGAEYNRVEHRGGRLVFAIHDEAFPYTRPRDDLLHFSLECTLIFLHAAVCELAQADLSGQVTRISTRRTTRTGPGAPGLEFWRAPVSYGAQAYAIAYDGALEGLPVRGLRQGLAPDLAVHNRILGLIERPAAAPPDRRIATGVRQALEAGASDQETVARGLGLSVATLRRRLAEEGASFRALRQAAMNSYARARILETREIAVVAEELGFSDPRAFTRAFKTWNGVTPSDYRDRGQTPVLSENVP